MNKKVENLHERRKKKKPMSLDDVARIAALDLFNPARNQLEEPVGLASGKTFTGGSFVPVTQAEILADRAIDDVK